MGPQSTNTTPGESSRDTRPQLRQKHSRNIVIYRKRFWQHCPRLWEISAHLTQFVSLPIRLSVPVHTIQSVTLGRPCQPMARYYIAIPFFPTSYSNGHWTKALSRVRVKLSPNRDTGLCSGAPPNGTLERDTGAASSFYRRHAAARFKKKKKKKCTSACSAKGTLIHFVLTDVFSPHRPLVAVREAATLATRDAMTLPMHAGQLCCRQTPIS